MTWPQQQQARDQRRQRRQQHERALLFSAEGPLRGEVERVPWEVALRDDGGNGMDAAMACGLTAMPQGAKALWGQSAEAAWRPYRHGQHQRQRVLSQIFI